MRTIFWIFLFLMSLARGGELTRSVNAVALSDQAEHEEARVEARAALDDLLAAHTDVEDIDIGYARAVLGLVEARQGLNEEAVAHLQAGLPPIAAAREGALWRDELGLTLSLIDSLERMGRLRESSEILLSLVARVRVALGRQDDADERAGPVCFGALPAVGELLPALMTRLAQVYLERKDFEAAELALQEAGTVEGWRLDGARATDAESKRKWERLTRFGGLPIRPIRVGRFGNPRAIRIVGAQAFTSDEIETALIRSSAFVLSSHAKAPFEPFLEMLVKSIEGGYLSEGFSSPIVQAGWDATDDFVVVHIQEGPRYRVADLRVTGASAAREERVRWWLVEDGEGERDLVVRPREEEVFRGLARKKEFPPGLAYWIAGGGVPVLPAPVELNEGWVTEPAMAYWRRGNWVNFTQSAQTLFTSAVHWAYMEDGYHYTEFELELAEGREEGTMDLLVKVEEESPLSLLGEVKVAGNVINSKDAILRYLGLEEGMALKGAFEMDLRRRLWESGRFLGWSVTSWRIPGGGLVGLQICLAEHWHAPPLLAPLTREQEALRRFVEWVNSFDMKGYDLVFSLAAKGSALEFELAARQDGGLIVRTKGHDYELFLQGGKDVLRIFSGGPNGKFLGTVSVKRMEGSMTCQFKENFRVADFEAAKHGGNVAASGLRTSGVSFGLGLGTGESRLAAGIDPASAFGLTEEAITKIKFENGIVEASGARIVIRFEEESGRLMEVRWEEEGAWVRLLVEQGRYARLEQEFDEAAQGVEDSLGGQGGWTMLVASAAFIKEFLVGVEEVDQFDDGSEIYRMIREAGGRARRWLPVALAVGKALESLPEEEEEGAFTVPIDPGVFVGGSTMAALGAAFYDDVAELVEPETWPDLLLREVLFSFHGSSQYLEETVESLYRMEQMGPLGCLVCAESLFRMGHYSAPRFVRKARGELDEQGFAKDWVLLRDLPWDEGKGGQVIKVLFDLKPEERELILSGISGISADLRRELEKVWSALSASREDTSPENIGPSMNGLWEAGVNGLVENLIGWAEERYKERADPTQFSLVVNGTPVPRAATRFDELLKRPILEKDSEEEWGNRVLFALELWKQGLRAEPKSLILLRDQVLKSIGSGEIGKGWEAVAAGGVSEEHFNWLLETYLTASIYIKDTVLKEEISEAEAREFMARRPDLFEAMIETHVHRIVIPKTGEGLDPAEQRKLAQGVWARIMQVEDPSARDKAFQQEARAHSVGMAAKRGGCLQWVVTTEWFNEKIARAVDLVPDHGLSEVIEEGEFLYLFQVPRKRRESRGSPNGSEIRQLALVDRAARRLRARAEIVRLEPLKEGEVYTEIEPAGALAGLKNKLNALLDVVDGQSTKESRRKGLWNELQEVREKAAEGDPIDLYSLGTFYERGVGMPRDLKEAHKYYARAAEAGEGKAMVRLAHLYLTGQGVERDVEKARKWREARANLAGKSESSRGAEAAD